MLLVKPTSVVIGDMQGSKFSFQTAPVTLLLLRASQKGKKKKKKKKAE